MGLILGVKLEESLKVNNNINTIDTGHLHGNHTNGLSSSSENESSRKEFCNGDLSESNSPKAEEKFHQNEPSSQANDKYLHKKFKKMATIAPYNYVNSAPTPTAKVSPLQLKMPLSSQSSPASTACSPSPEYLHRHINKLISDNQAIVDTMDPFWPKKYMQRSIKDNISPSSPNRNRKDSQSPNRSSKDSRSPISLHNRSSNLSPSHFTFKGSGTPSSPLLLSSASYEAAYIKSLMASSSPSSPLSSASSSSSTEFSWPKKSSNQHLEFVDVSDLKARQQTPESKLALALLRPFNMSSSRTLTDEDQFNQPLNLTVKQNNDNKLSPPPNSRKRPYSSSFPQPQDEALNCKIYKPPKESDMHVLRNNQQRLMCGPQRTVPQSVSLISPVKVNPPMPSPGPLLGNTPLVDSYKLNIDIERSHNTVDFKRNSPVNPTTLRSLEELSKSPMRSNSLQMFGGEVQIRDSIGDSKTMRIEPHKITSNLMSKTPDGILNETNSTKVVTMAKSPGLHSGGTTILQVPHPCESAQVPKSVLDKMAENMLLIPMRTKNASPAVNLASPHLPASPHNVGVVPGTAGSSYRSGVFTFFHAGKTIPHVPGIPGPLSLPYDEENMAPMNLMNVKENNKLSAEVKPIVKNGRVPSLCDTFTSSSSDVQVNKDLNKIVGDNLQIESSASTSIEMVSTHFSTTSEEPEEMKCRFLRPTSLPLKPGTYTPKRHLTSVSTMCLVSPETPRPRKGYGQLYLNGHAYTYLGLKCSTRLFFCTLNKPQPMYVPLSPEHKMISMYSNWKICSEVDPNPFGLKPAQLMAHYCSSTKPVMYTVAQSKNDLLVTHSSYWYKKSKHKGSSAKVGDVVKCELTASIKTEPKSPTESSALPSIPVGALVPEVVINEELNVEEKPKRRKIFAGGFESNEDYTYVRGRGRGRFVCEECGIRCRKPSMLKKHIKTHSDVRLYTCTFCSFSFKTKGNLTKHMKSKAHYKRCAELGVSPTSEEYSGDEKNDQRTSQSCESPDTEPGDSDEEDDEFDEEEDYDGEEYDDFDEEDMEEEEEEEEEEENTEDEERVNSELEHDVAHSLLSLAQMTPHIENAGLMVSTARPSTYPYSTHTTAPATTTTVMTTSSCIVSSSQSIVSPVVSTKCIVTSSMLTTSVITVTVPSGSSVSVLPTVRDSEKAAMSILPPTSPNSTNKKQAEFLPPSNGPTPNYVSVLKDGRSMCGICNKIFTKPSQLRLHVNIHYFERPFRCESCAVSFRTKGHLQKHQRSSAHLNKVNMHSTFGTPTTTNPRPFKCDHCKIAFRIHGHLAKHLRSKMHIMKLECVGKLPFGTYAELERCGYNLNDIDTTDCDNSLESLQLLAQKLYEKDPSKLGQWGPEMMPPQSSGITTSGSGESSDDGEILDQKTEPLHHDVSKSPVEI